VEQRRSDQFPRRCFTVCFKQIGIIYVMCHPQRMVEIVVRQRLRRIVF
jgi:hypothetical protein